MKIMMKFLPYLTALFLVGCAGNINRNLEYGKGIPDAKLNAASAILGVPRDEIYFLPGPYMTEQGVGQTVERYTGKWDAPGQLISCRMADGNEDNIVTREEWVRYMMGRNEESKD
ncbi:hypothetical protein ACFLQN_02520 [Candidatus Aenigmatarchaeota archaeon]